MIVGMTIALLLSMGMCIVPIQSVWVNFACAKRFLNVSAEAIIDARNAHLCARCGIFVLKIKQIPFPCRLVRGFTLLKRIQKQFKMSLDMCIVAVSIVSTEKNAKCKSIGGNVTTPRSVYGCDNCGAWLFVHKVPIALLEHVKTTKTDKTRFFFAKKDVTRQTIVQ